MSRVLKVLREGDDFNSTGREFHRATAACEKVLEPNEFTLELGTASKSCCDEFFLKSNVLISLEVRKILS